MKVKIEKKGDPMEEIKELQAKRLSFVAQGGEHIKTNMRMRCAHDSVWTIANVQVESYVTDGGAESETGCATDSMVPIYLEYGTGIHAKPEGGGTRAKHIPWTYYDEELDQFFTTSGMEAQPFAQPGFDAAKPGIDRLAEKVLRV
jgi:hypothetical protein